MELIESINQAVNDFVWGIPMLVVLTLTGIILTLRNRGVQFLRFGHAMKNTAGKIFEKHSAGSGEVTPFQAVSTALAATVGTGNITGVTYAITIGGPGAVFWMWVAGLLGMATKYTEVLLSVKYRKRDGSGDWVGGPMYYIEQGLKAKWLAVIFAAFGALAAFGIGSAVQAESIADSIDAGIRTIFPGFKYDISLIVGLVTAAVAAVVLIGGIKRIGSVTSKLVPFMSLIYIAACLAVIFANVSALPGVLSDIVRGAFSPSAVTGGAVGISVRTCIVWGMRRGIFSNEAGLGSAPIAHAGTSEKDPVRQGFYGIFEVFADTFVICTLTALMLLCSGIPIPYGTEAGSNLNLAAISTVFGAGAGSLIIAVGITLFAASTILSWGLYGTRCFEYIFGEKSRVIYQVVFVGFVVVGAVADMQLVWDIADTLNGLMALPNLIGVIGLSKVAADMTRDYFQKRIKAQTRL